MFTDAAYGARPVGRDRRGFLKELGLGRIALAACSRTRRLAVRRPYRRLISASRLRPGSHTSLPGRGTSSSCSWSVARVSLRQSITSRF